MLAMLSTFRAFLSFLCFDWKKHTHFGKGPYASELVWKMRTSVSSVAVIQLAIIAPVVTERSTAIAVVSGCTTGAISKRHFFSP
jgi:hypothetical protein